MTETLGQYWKTKKEVNAMFDEWLVKSDFAEVLKKLIAHNYSANEISFFLTDFEVTNFQYQIEGWAKTQQLKVRFTKKYTDWTAHFSLDSD